MVLQTAQARSAVYDFLSLGFCYPQAEFLSSLKAQAEGLELEEMCSVLESLSLMGLEAQYTQVLGHILSPECPPYETEYVSGGEAAIFRKTQRLADIVGFYRAWGLKVSEQAKERPDHIAIELEFMSYLACKEVYALAKGLGAKKIKLCREAQQKFLKEHLGWWGPAFTRLLERRSAKAGADFYEKLARLMRAWLEREFLALEVTLPQEASFHIQKEEPGCDTCPLAST